jgi:hypothetical protein
MNDIVRLLTNQIEGITDIVRYKDYSDLESHYQKIRTSLKDENRKYMKYVYLVITLTPLFLRLEEYSRYPMNDFSNENITLLSNNSHKFSINKILVLIDDLVGLVPLIWNQIDIFKNKIK